VKGIDILAIGVHPDDVELSCSGTIARHLAAGRTAAILDLTRGELGTRGNPELRTKEAMNAASILGVAERVQLSMRDGFFRNDEEHQLQLICQIRYFRPSIVLCNAIGDRHSDHGRAAQLTRDSCFYSGLSKIKTTFNGAAQQAWRPGAVYHYIQDEFIHPDFVIDVTPYVEVKQKAIMAFSSQFYDPQSTEPQTPISGKDFLESLHSKMSVWGRAIGVRYGEGFTVNRYPGVKDLFDLF
jgi:N-acetylglucosamine malate deacetylase 1